jgi:hypothetical protein
MVGSMKKRKINHNDLVPWFTEDHGTLPASYITSCREFFEWLDKSNQEGFRAPGHKPQASNKQQAVRKREIKIRVGPAHKLLPGPRRYVTLTMNQKSFEPRAMIRQSGNRVCGPQVQGPWNPHKVSRSRDRGVFLR